MKPLTSVADFYHKAKADRRYRLALFEGCKSVMAYDNYGACLKWMETWIADRVKPDGKYDTCANMIEFINRYIPAVQRRHPYPIPALDNDQNSDTL